MLLSYRIICHCSGYACLNYRILSTNNAAFLLHLYKSTIIVTQINSYAAKSNIHAHKVLHNQAELTCHLNLANKNCVLSYPNIEEIFIIYHIIAAEPAKNTKYAILYLKNISFFSSTIMFE